ncbi:MAG: hypothetical protein AAB420_02080 [Patescibacteria group bacterium]
MGRKDKFNAAVSALGSMLTLAVSLTAKVVSKGGTMAEGLLRLVKNDQALDDVAAILARLCESTVWRTLTVREVPTVERLIAAIEAKGRKVTDWARTVMSQPAFAATYIKPGRHRLVVIRGDEFEDAPQRTNANIWTAAEKLGYRKVPAYLAAVARAAWPQSELGSDLVVFMHDPITVPGDRPNLLVLDADASGEYLNTYNGNPENTWNRERLFVFLAPDQDSELSA